MKVSTPSVKFNAFVVAINTKISIIIFKIPAIDILSKKYTYIELFIFNPKTKTDIVTIPTNVSINIFFLGESPICILFIYL